MFSSRWTSFRLLFGTICLLGFLSTVSASIAYCSSLNIAETGKNSSDFQSNGLCGDFCRDQEYAFAVVQYKDCWCGNYAPATTTTGCTRTCPGYPIELCGGSGVYGYIRLDAKIEGTRGSDLVSSTSTQESTTGSTTDAAADTTSAPTSDSSSATWTPTPIVSVETITGSARTVTITPTNPPDSANQQDTLKKGSSGGLSTGGAVGLTIGLVALAAIVGGIMFFCWRKRRNAKDEELNAARESVHGLAGPTPTRTMSENSRYVLGTDGRQVVEAWEQDDRDLPGSRKSRLMPVDPRLDPFAPVYQRGENKSRESVNTMRDDHDYSRRVVTGPLRVINPNE